MFYLTKNHQHSIENSTKIASNVVCPLLFYSFFFCRSKFIWKIPQFKHEWEWSMNYLYLFTFNKKKCCKHILWAWINGRDHLRIVIWENTSRRVSLNYWRKNVERNSTHNSSFSIREDIVRHRMDYLDDRSCYYWVFDVDFPKMMNFNCIFSLYSLQKSHNFQKELICT